jgi:hypothetical protein
MSYMSRLLFNIVWVLFSLVLYLELLDIVIYVRYNVIKIPNVVRYITYLVKIISKHGIKYDQVPDN